MDEAVKYSLYAEEDLIRVGYPDSLNMHFAFLVEKCF
jgi:hypothetical protein